MSQGADPRRDFRLGFIGPHLSGHAGWVVTQSEILMRLFAAEGITVMGASELRRPILRTLDMMRALWRWRSSVDIVIVSVFSGRGFSIADAVTWVASRLGLRQVHVLRGGNFPELVEQQPRRVSRVLRRAEAVVAPSPFLARSAGRLGIECEVIPNVLDLNAYKWLHRSTLEPPVRLLWVRTFHEIYHPEMAIHALWELQRRGVDARLTMAGQDKGLEQACRELAAELGLTERVDFAGFLDMAAKQRLFAEHDVYLHTNRVDNTPVTVIEACAFGLPMIATSVGGLPDLIEHEVSGLLVDSEDAGAMARAVARLLAEPRLMDQLSSGGRQLAQRCAWSRVYEQWVELSGRLLR